MINFYFNWINLLSKMIFKMNKKINNWKRNLEIYNLKQMRIYESY